MNAMKLFEVHPLPWRKGYDKNSDEVLVVDNNGNLITTNFDFCALEELLVLADFIHQKFTEIKRLTT